MRGAARITAGGGPFQSVPRDVSGCTIARSRASLLGGHRVALVSRQAPPWSRVQAATGEQTPGARTKKKGGGDNSAAPRGKERRSPLRAPAAAPQVLAPTAASLPSLARRSLARALPRAPQRRAAPPPPPPPSPAPTAALPQQRARHAKTQEKKKRRTEPRRRRSARPVRRARAHQVHELGPIAGRHRGARAAGGAGGGGESRGPRRRGRARVLRRRGALWALFPPPPPQRGFLCSSVGRGDANARAHVHSDVPKWIPYGIHTHATLFYKRNLF